MRSPNQQDGSSVAALVNLNGGASPQGFVANAPLGDWHTAVITYDGFRDIVTFFVDGAEVSVSGPGALAALPRAFLIGSSQSSSTGEGRDRFCGQMHDVRVFDRPLGRQEARLLWSEYNHRYWFGDGTVNDCVVSEWSDWTPCSPMNGGAAASCGGAAQGSESCQLSAVQSRSRSILSGSVGCPPLLETEECGPGLAISPRPLTVSADSPSEFTVRLTTPPRHDGNVWVELDSSLADSAFGLSECVLYFNRSNWDEPQTVTVTPRRSQYTSGQQVFPILFRAFNYS